MSDAIPPGFKLLAGGDDFIAVNGPIYVKREAERAVLGLRLAQRHCRSGEVAHSAMLIAMVEAGMAYTIAEIHGRKATTASLTCDMLGAARLGDWVEARCETTRVALDVIFMRGEVGMSDGLVLTASALWKRWV